jgi:hypothetical protein
VAAGEIRRHATAMRRKTSYESKENIMRQYRVALKGRATKSALGDSASGTLLVFAWDKGEARKVAEREVSGGYRISGLKCDEVKVVSVAK